jgi:hypothetical protein
MNRAGEDDTYRLPEHMRDAVEAQYRRDVARVHGQDAVGFDDEYKSFMQVRQQGVCARRSAAVASFICVALQ